MLSRWYEELNTGNEDFDRSHCELFERIEGFMAAAKAGRGNEEVGRFLWFMQRYIRKHLTAEELLQRQLGYSGYSDHKRQHDRFIEDVRGIQTLFATGGTNTALTVKALNLISDWLKDHIKQKDREVAAFLRRVLPRR